MKENLSIKEIKRLAASGVANYAACPTAECISVEQKKLAAQKHEEPKILLEEAMHHWNALRSFREERERNVRYKNGDQWSDMVEDPSQRGSYIKEERLLSRGGKVPLKHNFIQQFMRNISGQMLSSPSQSIVNARSKDDAQLGEMLTNTLQACLRLNQNNKLEMGMLDELLLSGLVCQKIRYSYIPSKKISDGVIESINNNRIFFNTDIEDPRLTEIRLIGQIHDYTWSELIDNFAKKSSDETYLRNIYGTIEQEAALGYSGTAKENFSAFLNNQTSGKCRVFEIWQRRASWIEYMHDFSDASQTVGTNLKAVAEKENSARLEKARAAGIAPERVPLVVCHSKYEHYWHVSFITPTGELLHSAASPYLHGEHPYVITTMPMVDGSIRGMVTDLIDMQRYINRLVVMIDFIIGSSAKGVLMIPESAVPDGYSVDDFASEYVKADGVILYKPTPGGEAPYQIHRNSTDVGAWQMLDLQMNLMQQISGLSGAIQGQRAASGTPSSLYSQQAANSQLNYRPLFETIRHFTASRDEKLLKVLMQYYSEPRHISLSGTSVGKAEQFYLPQMADKVVDFNLVVSQCTDTPVYRQAFDDVMMSMVDKGYISFKQYLNNCSLPFAERLLSQMEQNQSEALTEAENPAINNLNEELKKAYSLFRGN